MIANILQMAALLSALAQSPTEAMIEHVARAMGVNPEYAVCIAKAEAGPELDPRVEGDNGRALGLYQWHYPSWVHVRQHMGLSTDDLRGDPVQATVTAVWAWKHGYRHWWSTAPQCGGAW